MEQKNQVISIRVTRDFKKLTEKLARTQGMTMTEYICGLIDKDAETTAKATTSDKIKKVVERMREDKQEAVLRLLELFA